MGILSRIFGGGAAGTGGQETGGSGNGTPVPSIDPPEAAEAISRGEGDLIDVRFDREYARERVPGSRLLPLPELLSRLAEIPRDRDVFLVSGRGARAHEAARLLRAQGFDRVRWVRGGVEAWGAPIERGAA